MNGNRRKSGSDAKRLASYNGRRKCVADFGLPTKRNEATGGSRKIADKGMQIKAGMENAEEDITQEGNANKGKAGA